MRKETKQDSAMTKAIGYLLATVGLIVAILFYILNSMTMATRMITELVGEGLARLLVENVGSIMWLGIGIMVVGLAAVAIEETKEEPE